MTDDGTPDYRADPSPWDTVNAVLAIGVVVAVIIAAVGVPVALAWRLVQAVAP